MAMDRKNAFHPHHASGRPPDMFAGSGINGAASTINPSSIQLVGTASANASSPYHHHHHSQTPHPSHAYQRYPLQQQQQQQQQQQVSVVVVPDTATPLLVTHSTTMCARRGCGTLLARCSLDKMLVLALVLNLLFTGYIFFTYVSTHECHEILTRAAVSDTASLEEAAAEPLSIERELERGVMIDPVSRVQRLASGPAAGVTNLLQQQQQQHDHVYQTVKYDFYLGTKMNVWERYPGGRTGLPDVHLYEGLFFTMCCHTKASEMVCSGGGGNNLMAKVEKDGDRAFLLAMFSDSSLAGSACTFTFTMDRLERQF